jgi:hypothetical protein
MLSLMFVLNFCSQSCLQNAACIEVAGAGSLPVPYAGGANKKINKRVMWSFFAPPECVTGR